MAKHMKFEAGDHVVYPAHGVGKVLTIENQEIAGMRLEVLVIEFEKEKMTLRLPTGKVQAAGLRCLCSRKEMQDALKTLKGRSRAKRTMWSRRAQEYEAKINSGDLIAIAEVVRDLYRSESQPEQSYSERQLYEAALGRMARELAAVNEVSETEAVRLIEVNLNKGPKRLPKGATAEGEAEAEGDNDASTEDTEQEREEAA